jgi:hypothetical protein
LHEEWDAAVVHVKAHLELGGLARRSDLICTTGVPAFSKMLRSDIFNLHTWIGFLSYVTKGGLIVRGKLLKMILLCYHTHTSILPQKWLELCGVWRAVKFNKLQWAIEEGLATVQISYWLLTAVPYLVRHSRVRLSNINCFLFQNQLWH